MARVKKRDVDLEKEKEKLEFLRDCKTMWDAILFYIVQPHLKAGEVKELRKALLYLTRGE